jgi:hypothetical protein
MDDAKKESQNSYGAGGQPDNQKIDFDDERTLLHYLNILWRWKRLIILGSVLPALVVGLILLLLPSNYTVTFVYEQSPTEKDYNVLLGRFHSAENLDKITNKLRESGLDEYAKKTIKARRNQSLEKMVKFKVLPFYPKRLKTTDPTTSEKIGGLKAQLLHIVIVARPEKDIRAIAAIITNNFKSIIPLYSMKSELDDAIREHRTKMGTIEENRFGLQLSLDREKATLAKLKNVKTDDSATGQSNVILQFNNVADSNEYLPLPYQIQAVESRIINIEETIRENQSKYDYYRNVLSLNEMLFDEIEDKMSSYYTIGQFHSFLTNLLEGYKDQDVADYLKSYIKKVENTMLSITLITENPEVYQVRKGIVTKTAFTFLVLLMIIIFVSFLLECLESSSMRQQTEQNK